MRECARTRERICVHVRARSRLEDVRPLSLGVLLTAPACQQLQGSRGAAAQHGSERECSAQTHLGLEPQHDLSDRAQRRHNLQTWRQWGGAGGAARFWRVHSRLTQAHDTACACAVDECKRMTHHDAVSNHLACILRLGRLDLGFERAQRLLARGEQRAAQHLQKNRRSQGEKRNSST